MPFPNDRLSEVFQSPAGPGAELFDPYDVANVSFAILGFWSFKLSETGDPHVTIPETFGPQIRRGSPSAKISILSDDIQHRRFHVEMNLNESQKERLKHRELATYSGADVVLFDSGMDKLEVRGMLYENFGCVKPRLEVLPYVNPTQLDEPHMDRARSTSFETRNKILLVSGGSRSSRIAVQWVINTVIPRIRSQIPVKCGNSSQIPPLTLVGDAYLCFPGRPDVELVGFRKNLSALFVQSRVALAPSHVASGISSKMHLYLAHGIPAVATSNATRNSKGAKYGSAAFAVRDEANAFANAVSDIFCSKELFLEMRNAAIRSYDTKARELEQMRLLKNLVVS